MIYPTQLSKYPISSLHCMQCIEAEPGPAPRRTQVRYIFTIAEPRPTKKYIRHNLFRLTCNTRFHIWPSKQYIHKVLVGTAIQIQKHLCSLHGTKYWSTNGKVAGVLMIKVPKIPCLCAKSDLNKRYTCLPWNGYAQALILSMTF